MAIIEVTIGHIDSGLVTQDCAATVASSCAVGGSTILSLVTDSTIDHIDGLSIAGSNNTTVNCSRTVLKGGVLDVDRVAACSAIDYTAAIRSKILKFTIFDGNAIRFRIAVVIRQCSTNVDRTAVVGVGHIGTIKCHIVHAKRHGISIRIGIFTTSPEACNSTQCIILGNQLTGTLTVNNSDLNTVRQTEESSFGRTGQSMSAQADGQLGVGIVHILCAIETTQSCILGQAEIGGRTLGVVQGSNCTIPVCPYSIVRSHITRDIMGMCAFSCHNRSFLFDDRAHGLFVFGSFLCGSFLFCFFICLGGLNLRDGVCFRGDFFFACIGADCVPGHQCNDHDQRYGKAKQTLQCSVHFAFVSSWFDFFVFGIPFCFSRSLPRVLPNDPRLLTHAVLANRCAQHTLSLRTGAHTGAAISSVTGASSVRICRGDDPSPAGGH